MIKKQHIQKFLITLFWLCISGGLLTLLIAANNNKKRGVCRDYKISIHAVSEKLFFDQADILKLVTTATGGKIKDKRVSAFDLRRIETMLKENVWMEKAELWFDNRDILHISVTEREPVARIFTTEGQSFYMDRTGLRMPLSDKRSARVPVFSGFTDKKILRLKDSLVLNDIRTMSQFILDKPFWMSQVAQIDITPDGKFEMIPVVGNHIVRLGDGTNLENKFNRLFVFYRQVLSKTGFDKYSILDLQYQGQVLGKRKGTGKRIVDSAQLKLNVEMLLKQIHQQQQDNNIATNLVYDKPETTAPVSQAKAKKTDKKKTTDLKSAEKKEDKAIPFQDSGGDDHKIVSDTTGQAGTGETKVPKAVMPKKNDQKN